MLYRGCFLVVSILCASLRAAPVQADDAMEFSLDEVESQPAPAASRRAGSGSADPEAHVARALGPLRWGMSSKELLALLKARMRAEYDERVKAEYDVVRQDALYQQTQARYAAIRRGFVVFDGDKTGWDVSPIAPEFRHKSHEAMLVVKGEGSRDYYFFINNRLWKWYRELEPSARGGTDFEGVSATMEAGLGPAKREQVARDEVSAALPTAFWDTQDTRVSVLDRGAQTCLVFESRRTLEALPILRKDALARGSKRNNVLEGILMDDDERDRWREEADAKPNPVDVALARRRAHR